MVEVIKHFHNTKIAVTSQLHCPGEYFVLNHFESHSVLLYQLYYEGSYEGKRNQYIELLYYNLLTKGKQPPAFGLEVRSIFELRS